MEDKYIQIDEELEIIVSYEAKTITFFWGFGENFTISFNQYSKLGLELAKDIISKELI